jgi:uncharacterized protein with PQ loop repeat
MIEVIGWIGGICLAVCALPQAIKSYRTKSSGDLSLTFILLWLVGELFTIGYILATTMQWPLLINYSFNILCLMVIIFYWRKK